MKDSGIRADHLNNPAGMAQQPQSGERSVASRIWEVVSVLGRCIYRLRKVFMAIPVVYYALKLAAYNTQNLPEMVGIHLQSNGEYAQLIAKNIAVMGPLAATGACLVLMFISRKSLYPWIISIFTLVLPLLILFTNNYPA